MLDRYKIVEYSPRISGCIIKDKGCARDLLCRCISPGRAETCQNRAHLSRRIGIREYHRSLDIVVLLEFDNCFFDLIQFVLSVKEEATLSGFQIPVRKPYNLRFILVDSPRRLFEGAT